VTFKESFSSNNNALSKHYDELVSKFGSDPKSNQWRDQTSQIRRFEILLNGLSLSLNFPFLILVAVLGPYLVI